MEKGGVVANYIPQLEAFGDHHWGVSLSTIDGQRLNLGFSDTPFTIQGVSLVLTYAICLNELGPERVHHYQGREPSGRSFNALALDHQKKPHNPLVNAGGLVSVALILSEVRPDLGSDLAAKYDFIFETIKKMAGNCYLHFNNSAYLAERRNSDRNFALAHFLAENKCLPSGVDVKKVLDLYCQVRTIF